MTHNSSDGSPTSLSLSVLACTNESPHHRSLGNVGNRALVSALTASAFQSRFFEKTGCCPLQVCPDTQQSCASQLSWQMHPCCPAPDTSVKRSSRISLHCSYSSGTGTSVGSVFVSFLPAFSPPFVRSSVALALSLSHEPDPLSYHAASSADSVLHRYPSVSLCALLKDGSCVHLV